MELVKPSIAFMWMTPDPLYEIEVAGRTCYKSENRMLPNSSALFSKKLVDNGHHAMIEHAAMSYKVVCDRGVTHEIVRHRLFSYAQESTRYCNYKSGVKFIIPPWLYSELEEFHIVEATTDFEYYIETFEGISSAAMHWLHAMAVSEIKYQIAIDNLGWSPQQARSMLPNSLKTEIVMTSNFREWRHFFKLRCAKNAHPQMQEVANMILEDARARVPVIFNKENL